MIKLTSILLGLSCGLFAQGNYSVTHAGNGCGGADLTASFANLGNHKQMNVLATGLFTREFGVVIFGDAPAAVALPNNCWVWTNLVTAHSFRSDTLGEWSFKFSWPLDNYAQFYIQVGTFREVTNGVELKTSDCLHAQHTR